MGEGVARELALAEGAVEVAHALERDGEVALVVGAIRLGLGPLLQGLQQGLVAAEGALGLAQRQVGTGLLVCHPGKARV